MTNETPIEQWHDLAALPVRAIAGGLINRSFVVGDPPLAVLQAQHPLFPAAVNEDIEVVTTYLARNELPTPLLVRTGSGELCHTDGAGTCWRMLTWIPGRSVDRIENPSMAAEAGRIVARWHKATAGLEHEFQFSRPGAHDTHKHMETLATALREHPGHRLYDEVAPLAEQILSAWSAWSGRLDGEKRVCHQCSQSAAA